MPQRRATIGWLLLFIPVTVIFYWKILLTRQFSLLTEREGINQGYAWLQLIVTSFRQGILPLWDPYALGGRSFPGEMQTGLFYPLHLLLALLPLHRTGVIAPIAFHAWFAFTHMLAAAFMFLLVRELGLSRFSAFVAGICFSLGGLVARVGWPDFLESAIWLPLVFLFFLRALRAGSTRWAILNAALGGIMFGLSILAGRLHVSMMETLVVVSAGIFYACSAEPDAEATPRRSIYMRAAIVVVVLGVVGVAAGAVQLLPSIEYGSRVYRFLGTPGALPANQKIPYANMADEWLPQGIGLLVIPYAFNGNAGKGETTSPYIGVFPLLAVVIGIRGYWRNLWVRYLAGLSIAAFLFSIGSFSPLHGVMYALVPKLWNLREASRMVYLEDFALVILAAYGVEALVSQGGTAGWPGLNRTLLGVVIACAAVLFVPAVFGKPDINPWNALSLLLIFAAYALYRWLENGNRGRSTRAILVALILFDLAACDWSARNLIEVQRTGDVDQWERIMSAHPAVEFLKAQPGAFRVKIEADPTPNIGDLYGLQTIDPASGATMPIDYARISGYPHVLNIGYVLTTANEQKPGAIYQDAAWKVYANPGASPRAWTVHETLVEPSPVRATQLLGTPGFDTRRTAVVEAPVNLEPLVPGAQESAQVVSITPNRIELDVDAQSSGLLVLSENYYPGWRATVDGQAAQIYRVDGALKGVIVPRGHSRVVLKYAPGSIYWGGLLSLVAFVGTLVAVVLSRRVARPTL